MRKVSLALAVVGLLVSACGGGDAQPPQTPAAPVATTPAPAPTAEVAKTEEPKATASPMELQKKTMMAYGEAMNARDAKKLASLFTDNAVMKFAGAPDTVGRDAIQTHYQKMFDAFTNSKVNAARVWMKGDVCVDEWAWTATHTGEMMGMKATEKPVGFMGVNISWFTPEGQIKEQHSYADMGTLMSQMGVSKQKARAIPTVPTGAPQVIVSTGSPDETKNLEAAQKMMGSFEKKSEADFMGSFADNIEWDDMTMPDTMKGKDQGKKFFKMMTTAFPDVKTTNANMIAVGDYVISEGAITGTHKGPMMGIQPTKKTVNMHGIDIIQFKDGKMVHGWSYGNGMEMMTQLGLVPPPGAKDAKAAPAAKADAKDAKPAAAPKTDAKPAAPAAPKK